MASSQYPIARTGEFVVQPMDGELLLSNGEVTHLLNGVAASVWQKCDGNRSITQIARELALDETIVEYALQQLDARQLIYGTRSGGAHIISRREFLRKGAIAAAAIPVVQTLKLPAPQDVASGCNCGNCTGQPCTISENCDLGDCVNGCCVLF